ncbi:MAG: DUF1080 domain-containing protein [Verrucomicrobiae bacterium]|nr:DUF1080 domain-containing protein [Verrucomicrobiae bacterium]
MNRIIIGTVLLSLGAIVGVYLGIRKEPVWISLFNGQDLEGWEVKCVEKDSGKNYWSVQNGYLTCNSMGDKDHASVWLQHLVTLDDFELRLKFRAHRDSPGNSGVQVRSRWIEEAGSSGEGRYEGPQIDIHPPTPWRTGLIYDETEGAQRWIYPDLPNWKIEPEQGPQQWIFGYADDPRPWNDLLIRCEGTRITTTLNQLQVADYDGDGLLNDANHQKRGVGMKGHIALQLHVKDELLLEFKDIYVREL